MALTLADIAADEALREIAGIGAAAGSLTYGTYRASMSNIITRSGRSYLRGGGGRSRSRSGRSSSSSRSSQRALAPRGLFTLAPAARSRFSKTPYWRTLGLRPGRYPSKKHVRTFSNSALLDKTQYVERLVSAPYSTDEKMNSRQGRLANVRGVKLRIWFNLKNQSEASNKFDYPIMVRWAILNPKENTGELGDVGPTNFFISVDPETEEATDFPGVGTCFQYQNRQINRRQYGVMQQGKFLLHQDPASTNDRLSLGAQKSVYLWLPIKRQMKWANNVTETPNTNIYFVYWYTIKGDKDTAKKFTDGPIDMTAEAITYFKDSPGFN